MLALLFDPCQKTATAAKFLGGMNGHMIFVGEQYGQSVWSNFPDSDVPRLGNLSPAQRAAAMQMLQVMLSPKERTTTDAH
jgi:hypothetical protein